MVSKLQLTVFRTYRTNCRWCKQCFYQKTAQ